MNLLLDTNAFIWIDSNDSMLSTTARALLQDPANIRYISLVSIWEMQIKHQLGKLALRLPLDQIVHEQSQKNDIRILPLETEHIYQLYQLPLIHRDPFDRLLIAQAQYESMDVISADGQFRAYSINVKW
jgi:PIN domain nuclease of toxin-antitoxin system